MGLLDAFTSTWEKARETYGQGTPQGVSQFDNSARLQQMQDQVTAAAPDHRWQGPASDAYAARNKQHAEVYGKLAGLEKRLAAEIDNSAATIVAGRQNLDNIRSTILSAASGLDENKPADRTILTQLVSNGMGQIQDTLIAHWNHKSVSENQWSNHLDNVATYTVGPVANPVDAIAQRYEDLAKVPNP